MLGQVAAGFPRERVEEGEEGAGSEPGKMGLQNRGG